MQNALDLPCIRGFRVLGLCDAIGMHLINIGG